MTFNCLVYTRQKTRKRRRRCAGAETRGLLEEARCEIVVRRTKSPALAPRIFGRIEPVAGRKGERVEEDGGRMAQFAL